FGCIRMVPTDPGIPATPAPLVCPKLEPAELTDCFNSSAIMCEAAVIKEPVITCRRSSHKLHGINNGGEVRGQVEIKCDPVQKVWTYPSGTRIRTISVACILYGGG
ncbi:hypothetical protein PENTCL1PPCAC_9767, partial [Pristionchus entomophagus]